ncbi:MAG: hypothetical protein KDA80_08440 [Planctomycetaceae bacterium]|nr:hypothetical protein [Planctomycetaceae bacterium]
MTILFFAILSGCNKPEPQNVRETADAPNPVPPPAAFENGVTVEGLPVGHQCQTIGSIRPEDSGVLIWEVPGKVAFDIVIPCDQQIDVENLWTSVVFDPDGVSAECSSGKPVADLTDGKLHLTVEHEVLAAFDTKQKIALRIDRWDDGTRVEIGRISIPLKFESL